jgi:hypothetical protein
VNFYLYLCRTCNTSAESIHRGDTIGPCKTPDCPGELRRKFVVSLQPPMMDHYNASVNGIVSSERGFKDKLKQQSDEYSERTGIEARFVPIDPKDAGATNEGMESTNAVRVAKGLKPVEF